jgi:hypothetical protein
VNVRLLKQAQAEVDASFENFEVESQGKGHYFLDCLSKDFARLSVVAGVHVRLFGFQRMKMRKFEHIIFYEIQSNQIVVVSVVDGRGHPAAIEQRVRSARDELGAE